MHTVNYNMGNYNVIYVQCKWSMHYKKLVAQYCELPVLKLNVILPFLEHPPELINRLVRAWRRDFLLGHDGPLGCRTL